MDDVNKLLVLVEANTRSYENAMKKLEGITKSAGRKSGSGFDPVKKALQDIETGTGRVGNSVNRMQRDLADAAQKTVKPFELNRMQLQNMSFQINDLAQGLATGQQSPFVLIAQQGSQIAQIFGSGTGVVAAFKATGAAIGSFITNPINLAVIGIAAATVAVPALWNTFVGSGAKSAADQLTAIDELLLRIAESNQAAADAAQRFIDKQTSAASLLADTNSELLSVQKSLASEVERISFLASSMSESFFAPLLPATQLREEIRGLGSDLKDETITVEEFRDRLAEIALSPDAPDSIVELSNELRVASQDAADLEARILGLGAAIKEIAPRTNESIANEINSKLGALNFDENRLGGDISKKPSRAKSRATRSTTRRSSSDRDADKRAREIQREQEAVDRLINSLQTELDLVGASDLARQKANATRNLGASVTDEQRAKIQQLTEQLYLEQEAWKQTQEAQQFFENAAANSLSGLINGTLNAEDAVKQLTNSIIQAGLQALLLGQGPLAGLLGLAGGGGGLLAGLFGGLFGRAGGGNVTSNMPYMVGERGPELFIPHTAGRIAANQNIGGGSFTQVNNINATGADPAALERVRQELRDQRNNFARNVQGVNNVTSMRNLRA